MVGYACNFACAHCITAREKREKLTSAEIRLLISQINKHTVKSLLFVGGETSLYVRDINTILLGIRKLDATKVKITTNGHFAITKTAAKEKILSFHRLNSVQLSYDKFHAEFLPFRNVRNLYAACKDLGLEFSVILTIESPLDIVYAKRLWGVGKFPIGIQKVLQIGKAVSNKNAYVFPSFDKKVLKRSCPNLNRIKYLPGQGFSICCSLLAYKHADNFTHTSLSKHLRSRFYGLVSKYSFGEIAHLLNINVKNLEPRYSHECNLCEYIFKKGRQS